MMEFKNERSVGTFLKNLDNFRNKFSIKYEIKDQTSLNWLFKGKTLYWWEKNSLTQDPDYNATILDIQVYDNHNMYIVDIESYLTGQKYSVVFNSEKLVSRVK